VPANPDALVERTLEALARLDRAQRDHVVDRILRADPELEPVVRAYLAVMRLRMPLRRDGLI
jgi:hypothetical protein